MFSITLPCCLWLSSDITTCVDAAWRSVLSWSRFSWLTALRQCTFFCYWAIGPVMPFITPAMRLYIGPLYTLGRDFGPTGQNEIDVFRRWLCRAMMMVRLVCSRKRTVCCCKNKVVLWITLHLSKFLFWVAFTLLIAHSHFVAVLGLLQQRTSSALWRSTSKSFRR